MIFKEWLVIQESIIVNNGREEVSLGKSNEASKVVQFSYAAEDYESSFEIWPFSQHRPGYVSSDNATVIGIIKNTPIFPGNGADRAFIKSLTAALQASGHKPMPYKEGDSQWMGAFKDAGVGEDNPSIKGMKGEKSFAEPESPKMGTPSPNSRNITSGISVSRASGSWAYFIQIRPGEAEFKIRSIENMMKNSIKPLLDNSLIDYYRIVRGWNYKGEEWVWSPEGDKKKKEGEDVRGKSVAYLKFLAERMLSNYPRAREAVMSYFRNSWNKDIKPENTRVSLDILRDYVKDYQGESSFLNFFIDALEGDKNYMYEVLEGAASTPSHDEAITSYKEIAEEEYEYIIRDPRLWMSKVLNLFSMSEFLSASAGTQFEKFRKEYESAINSWLSSGEQIRPRDIEDLKKLSEYISVKGKDQIHDAHVKIKRAEEEEKTRREKEQSEAKVKSDSMIREGDFKYMVSGEFSWRPIPFKFLDGIEVEVGRMALEEDIVDKESVLQDAYDMAHEDAMENAEERNSLTYGEDKKEVESDIDYEWDDYVKERFEDGSFEGAPEDEVKDEIKKDHIDDFIDWKKEKLKEEEEEESWKYEPEPEDSDVRKYEEELAEKRAYENGFVVFKWPEESEEIEDWLHSKHMQKAREEVRKSLAFSMKEKDKYEEPILKRNKKVEFHFVDEGSGLGPSMRASEV